LTPATKATPAAAGTSFSARGKGASAQQEFSATQKSGQLGTLLSDSIAAAVLQFSDSAVAPTSATPDLSALISQLVAAYAAPETPSQSNTPNPEMNPALAILQALQKSLEQPSDSVQLSSEAGVPVTPAY
jgi:hypothetical protein